MNKECAALNTLDILSLIGDLFGSSISGVRDFILKEGEGGVDVFTLLLTGFLFLFEGFAVVLVSI